MMNRKPKIKASFNWLPTLILFAALAHPASHATSLSENDKLKAAYLFNFTRFLEWQNEDFRNSESTINICIGDTGEFKIFLQTIVKNRHVGRSKKPINILSIVDNSKNIHCHLSYIRNKAEADSLLENNLLKVGDTPMMGKLGTAINFFNKDNKIRFEVYPQRLQEQGVSLSSELLKLAHVVE